jgi:hypothetical protein
MVFVVIRVSGADFAVDGFLAERDLAINSVWHKGETSLRGRLLDESGFNLALPDAESWVEALPLVHSFLQSERDLFRDLSELNVEMELDIGVTVGEEKSFAPSLQFPIDFLAELISCGIYLNVSAYPTSDET